MKPRFLMASLAVSAFFACSIPAAWALTIVDTLHFPSPALVKDVQSGNGIDYTYIHTLTAPADAELLSGRLKLTHAGNSDEGPRQELWSAFSGEGILLGKLSLSEPDLFTDEWLLPAPVLAEFLGAGWRLEVGLSEQTAFNSEQIELFRSVLEIDYARPEAVPSAVPEPGSFFLIAAGLLFTGAGRKYLRIRDKKNSV